VRECHGPQQPVRKPPLSRAGSSPCSSSTTRSPPRDADCRDDLATDVAHAKTIPARREYARTDDIDLQRADLLAPRSVRENVTSPHGGGAIREHEAAAASRRRVGAADARRASQPSRLMDLQIVVGGDVASDAAARISRCPLARNPGSFRSERPEPVIRLDRSASRRSSVVHDDESMRRDPCAASASRGSAP